MYSQCKFRFILLAKLTLDTRLQVSKFYFLEYNILTEHVQSRAIFVTMFLHDLESPNYSDIKLGCGIWY